jgi:2-methylcitrate dehydratase PrpD
MSTTGSDSTLAYLAARVASNDVRPTGSPSVCYAGTDGDRGTTGSGELEGAAAAAVIDLTGCDEETTAAAVATAAASGFSWG